MSIRYEIKTVHFENDASPHICGMNGTEDEDRFRRTIGLMNKHGWTMLGDPASDVQTTYNPNTGNLITWGTIRVCMFKDIGDRSIFAELKEIEDELEGSE